ncbi:MAG: nicotinate (nicotinamide) nucleotide adenylyltransferase [Sulfurimonadaceae bacterium]
MENVALFGGSFDPPHIGHVAVVDALLKRKEIEGVVVMPAYLNPFKSKSFASASQRVAWLRRIFASTPRVIVDDYEARMHEKVPSIQTVRYLLGRFKKVYLVIGADNLEGLMRWHKYDELSKLVTFIVAARGGVTIPKHFLKLDVDCDVSSTQLREKIDVVKLPKICADEITKYYKEIDADQN